MWTVGGTVGGTGVRAQGGRICSEWVSGGLFLRAKLQTALVQPTPSVPRVCNEVWETSDPNQSIFPCNPEGSSGYSSSRMRKGREEGIEGYTWRADLEVFSLEEWGTVQNLQNYEGQGEKTKIFFTIPFNIRISLVKLKELVFRQWKGTVILHSRW